MNGHVRLALADGSHIMGSITNEAIENLGLKAGEPAVAIIKATDFCCPQQNQVDTVRVFRGTATIGVLTRQENRR